jgi:hypothetical protein
MKARFTEVNDVEKGSLQEEMVQSGKGALRRKNTLGQLSLY